MKFSERIGVVKVDDVIQIEGMSDDLRHSLWNAMDQHIFSEQYFVAGPMTLIGEIGPFSRVLWTDFFKRAADTRSQFGHEILKAIRDFYFVCEWFHAYDLVEFVSVYFKCKPLQDGINVMLERELSGFRMIDWLFVPITDKSHRDAIEQAIQPGPYAGVESHLRQAMRHLASRDSPDYRNSIKESISAVESAARSITSQPKASLGDALQELEKHHKLHPALKKGMSSIYGYTSDEGGIRHAMMDDPSVDQADAMYFLVSCSAFINFLKAKHASGSTP